MGAMVKCSAEGLVTGCEAPMELFDGRWCPARYGMDHQCWSKATDTQSREGLTAPANVAEPIDKTLAV